MLSLPSCSTHLRTLLCLWSGCVTGSSNALGREESISVSLAQGGTRRTSTCIWSSLNSCRKPFLTSVLLEVAFLVSEPAVLHEGGRSASSVSSQSCGNCWGFVLKQCWRILMHSSVSNCIITGRGVCHSLHAVKRWVHPFLLYQSVVIICVCPQSDSDSEGYSTSALYRQRLQEKVHVCLWLLVVHQLLSIIIGCSVVCIASQ